MGKRRPKIIYTKTLYNVCSELMTAFVCALTGFGAFWVGALINCYNVFFNMFLGMMMSALMYNAIKQMYPTRRKGKEAKE